MNRQTDGGPFPSEAAGSDGRADGAGDGLHNPYISRGTQPRDPGPDLDAHAQELRSEEARRLNRKALVFLAGIVLLILVAIAWAFGLATGDGTPAAPARQEAIVIPAMPQLDAPQALAPSPVPTEASPLPVLPPLPPELPGYDDPFEAPYQAQPAPPSLAQRRMASTGSPSHPPAQPVTGNGGLQVPQAEADASAASAGAATASTARFIVRPDTLLVRGTYIRCILQSRIVTDLPGFTACVVSEPVYSLNGAQLLLPRGSRILGRYGGEPGGPRVAVVWDRIVTPTGLDVAMASPGVDDLGSAGHPGDYDAHWGSRITSALLISIISDAFKYAAADQGPRSAGIGNGFVVQDPYESATARTMERLANEALDRSGRRPATVTINQGTALNVYVARDVDFSGVMVRP